jgi:hypothetical protein
VTVASAASALGPSHPTHSAAPHLLNVIIELFCEHHKAGVVDDEDVAKLEVVRGGV